MDRYRNKYNSPSRDEYSGGTWIYMNGELYHAGVKGMHWYQHLPGTDWWKLAKRTYSNYMNKNTTTEQRPGYQYVDGKMVPYEPQTKRPSKLKALYETGKNVGRAALASTKAYLKGEASYYGKKAKTAVTNVSKELSDFAKQAYSSVRGSVTNFLEKGKGLDDYINQKISGSGVNAWFENAKQGILKGVNSFLDKIGMRKETDNFISKKSNIPLSSLPKKSSMLPSEQKLVNDSYNDINSIGKPGYVNKNVSLKSVNDQVDEKLKKQGLRIIR